MVRAGPYSQEEPLQRERNFLAVSQSGHPRHPHSPPPLSHIFSELAAANTRCLHLAGLQLKKGACYRSCFFFKKKKKNKKTKGRKSGLFSPRLLLCLLHVRMRTHRHDKFVFYFVTQDTSVRQGRTFQSLK